MQHGHQVYVFSQWQSLNLILDKAWLSHRFMCGTCFSLLCCIVSSSLTFEGGWELWNMATFPAVLFVFLKGAPVLTSGFPYQVWVCLSSFFFLFVLFISCTYSRKILGTCSGADVLNQTPFSYIITSDQKQRNRTSACRQDMHPPILP